MTDPSQVPLPPNDQGKTPDDPARVRPPRRLRREAERVRRLSQLAEMGKLAAGLAHELKNPLSTLKLNLQLLEEDLATLPGGAGGIGQRSITRVATLKKEADRLRQTLDDFLRYAGRLELRLETVSLNSVVEELMDFLLPQAQASRIRVHTSLARENPLCRLDVNLFKQALLNLLLNAIQAMPVERTPGGSENAGELLVQTVQDKDSAILYVSDTGVGIPTENLPQIFEAYFTTKKGGTGLGLPTTRRIIEEHDGHITVQSEPGKGTSFRVELPLAHPSIAAPVPSG
ncbi:MAG TPA: ATP-binding protein [Phycisphaerae bacterium]|jgi:signal transduction histidine kinase